METSNNSTIRESMLLILGVRVCKGAEHISCFIAFHKDKLLLNFTNLILHVKGLEYKYNIILIECTITILIMWKLIVLGPWDEITVKKPFVQLAAVVHTRQYLISRVSIFQTLYYFLE